MALTPNFTTTQTPGAPEDINFEDLSTGTDGAVTKRRIYVQTSNGDFLVASGNSNQYSDWPNFPTDTTITISDILVKDVGARVVVQWLDVSNNILYDKTRYFGFTCFNEDFDYETTQNVAGNQLLMNDNNFWFNKSLLRTYIDSGDNAIERASDINAAQQCYNLATELHTDSQYLFNANS